MNDIEISYKFQPLFELLNNDHSDVDTVILTGGRGCFHSNQLVRTDKGVKPISEIKTNDVVLSYNEETKSNELKRVTETFVYPNSKIFKIKLKNGSEINVTENHKFFYQGGWITIKHLLSLWYGNLEENKEV